MFWSGNASRRVSTLHARVRAPRWGLGDSGRGDLGYVQQLRALRSRGTGRRATWCCRKGRPACATTTAASTTRGQEIGNQNPQPDDSESPERRRRNPKIRTHAPAPAEVADHFGLQQYSKKKSRRRRGTWDSAKSGSGLAPRMFANTTEKRHQNAPADTASTAASSYFSGQVRGGILQKAAEM
jgi:hypothetical protein